MSEFSLRHQIPNLLTLARIAAVPVLILFLYEGRYGAALTVFVLAGITDGLDGWIAKRFKCVTRLGSILDPLADKILIVSTYVMLVLAGDLPFWLILLIGFRDLGIIAGVLVLNTLNGHVQMQPSLLSKVNTFLQISLVILVMVERIGLIALEPVAEILLWFVAVTTVASAIHYVYFWFIHPLESRVDQKLGSKD
ncbi:MAG: CDP-alcohol phosphatidyltransferase family protein [Proteobacteria bacterium]|jgi:cardiolipin synthase|nr:CDP-alcohol phosphatidyltransferase family protein [Pseudomonadota bacterium]MBT6065595.1 CDP-alcohol phosphatidyltransferase family protein [Pseudomonadota bacterium]MBT6069719.1 CDP-alcohol phosphatidyltransferase family protein [Pseudomonadota bacterium]MBT7110230.1 CDP-alcohol phosphatidyltransferase family protein [Pseudomonadota bacterium]MBT7671428.1 CDP-alcohol phosphatidyltransferase family protein [Pseudomonadota bacterium]